MAECLAIFVDNLKYYFKNYMDCYYYMYDLLSYLVSLEPKYDKRVYLNESIDVLVERINKRNRNGESIQRSYL